jgi:hypothetical protein
MPSISTAPVPAINQAQVKDTNEHTLSTKQGIWKDIIYYVMKNVKIIM